MIRPKLIERTRYQPSLPVEDFMVPLLLRHISSILGMLPTSDPAFRVLDVGCGGQPFRQAIVERGLTYVSMDAQDPTGVVDVVAEIDGELPSDLLRDGLYDFILCTEVLEHVVDWDMAFGNLAKLLKPMGRLLVTCPHVYVLHEQPYDFWRPTLHALRTYGVRHGLEPISIEAAGDAWDVLGTLLGATHYSARPVRTSLGNRLLAHLIDMCGGLVHATLKKGWLQGRVHLGNHDYPIYLSNVALFSKTDDNGERNGCNPT